MKLAELEALKAQIAELEWLLDRAEYDPKTWSAKIVAEQDEGKLRLSLRLTPRSNRHVDLCCSSTAPQLQESFAGTHHYFINGNHWYDRFAVSTMKSALAERDDEDSE